MKILITGGSGLLGSKIAELSVKKGFKVYSGHFKNKSRYGLPIEINVCHRNSLNKRLNLIKPDYVIHAAAVTDVDKCESDRHLAYSVNVDGTKNILEASKKIGAFFMYISSDYVFPGKTGAYTENDTPMPINFYGETKLLGEKLVLTSSLSHCIIRPSLIFSPSRSPRKTNFPLWLLDRLIKNQHVEIITDQYVSPVLSKNLSDMILEIIERQLDGVYHLAGATPINRYDFAKLIARTFSLDETLLMKTTSNKMNWIAKRPKNNSLNVDKALKILNNKPLQISESLEFFKKKFQYRK